MIGPLIIDFMFQIRKILNDYAGERAAHYSLLQPITFVAQKLKNHIKN